VSFEASLGSKRKRIQKETLSQKMREKEREREREREILAERETTFT
jgi:hypothetical protein